MPDSKPGSRTWARALRTVFHDVPTIYPADVDVPGSRGWLCRHEGGGCTAGYGLTPEEAYVDYVEEHWCLVNFFPPDYPA